MVHRLSTLPKQISNVWIVIGNMEKRTVEKIERIVKYIIPNAKCIRYPSEGIYRTARLIVLDMLKMGDVALFMDIHDRFKGKKEIETIRKHYDMMIEDDNNLVAGKWFRRRFDLGYLFVKIPECKLHVKTLIDNDFSPSRFRYLQDEIFFMENIHPILTRSRSNSCSKHVKSSYTSLVRDVDPSALAKLAKHVSSHSPGIMKMVIDIGGSAKHRHHPRRSKNKIS